MSWMDSWSRPTKSQATPAPYYLTHGDTVPYCHTCGRTIGSRRANTSKAASTEVKYCSDRCKRGKPSTAPDGLERRIEDALLALLEGRGPPGLDEESNGNVQPAAQAPKPKAKPKKGDPRSIISLTEVETAVFGNRKDPEKVYGRRKNRKARFIKETGEWKSIDMEDSSGGGEGSSNPDPKNLTEYDTAGSLTADEEDDPETGVKLLATHVRPAQTSSDVNFSVGGERGWSEKIEETPEMLLKRREGQRRAEEREMVRCVVRRAVVFGLLVDDAGEEQRPQKGKQGRRKADGGEEVVGERNGKIRRKCEALVGGAVVEPSFAKGDWSVRWRED